MNELSWLIYLAVVAGNVDWVFSVVTFVLIVVVVGTVLSTLGSDGFDTNDWGRWRKMMIWSPIALILAVILGSIVPSKETVYAIAASEMGERAFNSETGNKAFQALNAWLDRQITTETSNDQAN